MRKTALNQLKEWIAEQSGFTAIELHNKINELLQEEKQQIVEAVKYGFKDAHKPKSDLTFEQYYSNTFKND